MYNHLYFFFFPKKILLLSANVVMQVYPTPTIGVLSTGDELSEPATKVLSRGQVPHLLQTAFKKRKEKKVRPIRLLIDIKSFKLHNLASLSLPISYYFS